MKRFERSNGLDTALYKNYFFLNIYNAGPLGGTVATLLVYTMLAVQTGFISLLCDRPISAWARTTKRVVSLPVSGQSLIMFFGKLIMSRTQNDVIAVWIL